MVIFETVRYKNLLSAGNTWTEIKLNQHRTTLVVGENGSGKSTLLDALSFALFGKPFRKVNKGQLVNSINQRGMVVELEFRIGVKRYIIRRGLKPNVFELYSDGLLLNQDASSHDYQDILETQILKFNHKTFTQIVAAGSALFVPFMQLSAPNRREIVEDLLDLQIFSSMNNLLKKDLETNRTTIGEVNQEINLLAQKIEINSKHIKTYRNNTLSSLERKREKQTQIAEQIRDAEAAIKQINQSIAQYKLADETTVVAKVRELEKIASQLQHKLGTVHTEIQFLEKNNNCPVCKQGIPHEHKHSEQTRNKSRIEKLQASEKEVSSALDQARAEQEQLRKARIAVGELQAELRNRTNDLNLATHLQEQLNHDIEAMEVNEKHIVELEGENAAAVLKKEELLAQKDLLFKDRQVMEISADLLKDSGIKTKIVKQYVPIMNKLINKYLASMDFFVNFELNENFEEVIRSRYRDEFSYQSFSEGEKARLDIALLFTWRAIARLRNSASTNLLIMDEIFDSSLDLNGGEELLKLITELATESNVFVISHKTDQMIDKFERTIKFEKVKSFSMMVNS